MSPIRLSNNLADEANGVDIIPQGGTTFTKKLNAPWAAGNAQGGLDQGTKASSATYHVWEISRDSDGVTDWLLSGSPSNPLVPAGWSLRGSSVGAVRTDSQGGIIKFVHTGSYFGLRVPVPILANNTVNNGAIMWPLAVPTGVKVRARVRFMFQSPTQATYLGVKDPDEGVATVDDVMAFSHPATNADFVTEVYTNTVGQIFVYGFRSDTTVISSRLLGWHYHGGAT